MPHRIVRCGSAKLEFLVRGKVLVTLHFAVETPFLPTGRDARQFLREPLTLSRVDEQRAAWAAEREAKTFLQRVDREGREADADLQRRRLEREEPHNLSTVDKLKPEPKAQPMTDEDRQWVQRQLETLASALTTLIV